jgi:hypothetical protein
LAASAGLTTAESWEAEGRWFAALSPVGVPEDPQEMENVVMDEEVLEQG